jgi:threonine synthase
MNVGHPSNMARIIALYGGLMDERGVVLKSPDLKMMRKDMFAVSVSDSETRNAITSCYRQFRIVLDPHGAVAWEGLQKYLKTSCDSIDENQIYCILETAHPAKFMEEITKILNIKLSLPESLKRVENRKEEYLSLENDYDSLKNYISKDY